MKILPVLGLILILSLVQSSTHNDNKKRYTDIETANLLSENIAKINNAWGYIFERIEKIIISDIPIWRIYINLGLNSILSLFKSFPVQNNFDKKIINGKNNVGFFSLNKDILIFIGTFLTVPQRELGRVDKSFSQVFLKDFPFHQTISKYFNITELLSADCNDDLFWFEDKYEVFRNDSNHFFILLIDALIVGKKFSCNEKLLLKYVYKVHKNFDLSIFWAGENSRGFYYPFSKYLLDQQYYDLLISFFLNDSDFPLINNELVLSITLTIHSKHSNCLELTWNFS